jgi:glutamate carboxypeptidase
MKAGLIQGFYAVADCAHRSGITILVTGDEEIGSPTSRALIESEARNVEAVLVLEAAADGGALKTARKGTSDYRIEIGGRTAHAGLNPERGVNATIEAAHQILTLAALNDPARGSTVTPTQLSSGTAANTVPGSARLAVDVRATTRSEQERIDARVRALTPTLEGAEIVVAGGLSRPPFPAAASAALYQRATRIADDLGLGPLGAVSVGGASDGNLTADLGRPTLDGLGAVGGGAHADDEHVVIETVAERVALLTALLTDLVSESFPGPG